MNHTKFPILEFDNKSEPLLKASSFWENIGAPEHCVMTFFPEVIEKIVSEYDAKLLSSIPTVIGDIKVYEFEYNGKKMALAQGGLGAPVAALNMEMYAALGCRKFMACGNGGVLDKNLHRGSVIIPDEAVRDEGTSYHYLPAERTIALDKEIVEKSKAVLESHGISYRIGKTWTTDAIFRETKNKIELRKQEGCLIAEMECAAFAAVAQHFGYKFGQLLGPGDDISGSDWDSRYCDEKSSHNEKLFWLAVEICTML